jgi:hypothetical protein
VGARLCAADRFNACLDADQKPFAEADPRLSCQAYTSAMPCSASGAMINSVAIAALAPFLDFFARKSAGRVIHQVGLSPSQLFFLPVMDWNGFGSGRKVIPQVLYKPKLIQRTDVKD